MKTIVFNKKENSNVNRVIEGTMFIIPRVGEYEGEETFEHWNKWQKKYMSQFGYTPKKGEKFVQVWVFTPGDNDSNWACHYCEFAQLTGVEDDRFPDYLPYAMIESLKEGDVLELHREDGRVFRLKAEQKGHRHYYEYGLFDQVLDKLFPIRTWETVNA